MTLRKLPLLAAAIVTMVVQTLSAAEATFYLGTYTGPKSKGIYVGKIDTATGKLSPLELAAEAKSPSFVALSPDGKYLYAAIEAGGGSVGAFSVGEGGKLTALNMQSSGGGGACHVSVDHGGKNVFVANYGGGSVAAYHVKPDGSLSDRTAFVQYEGTGPNTGRQEKPHAHSIYTDAADRFVYSCDLGTDKVWIFKLDAAKGTLTPNDPAFGQVPPGAGPRHLAMSPNGNFAYVNNEMGMSVTAFARNPESGALSALQTLPTIPEGVAPKGLSTAEIFTHPSGKWLYVSNRTHGSIAVYSINADGRLALVDITPAGVKVPRGFALDPSGQWLIAGCQDEHKIVVHRIDPATGRLTLTGESAEVGAPVCVAFAPGKP